MKEILLKLIFNILKVYMTFTFLSGKMKIEKVEKLLANLHDKTAYVVHIRNLKRH